MATGTLNDNTTLNETFTITKKDNTKLTLSTGTKYVDKNIEVTFNVRAASPSYTGGTPTNGTATINTSASQNIEVESANNSGVKIALSGSAKRSAVTYNGGTSGWLEPTSGTTALAAESSNTSWSGSSYYVKGVTLTNGKSFYITVPNGNSGTITFHFSVDNSGNTTVT